MGTYSDSKQPRLTIKVYCLNLAVSPQCGAKLQVLFSFSIGLDYQDSGGFRTTRALLVQKFVTTTPYITLLSQLVNCAYLVKNKYIVYLNTHSCSLSPLPEIHNYLIGFCMCFFKLKCTRETCTHCKRQVN